LNKADLFLFMERPFVGQGLRLDVQGWSWATSIIADDRASGGQASGNQASGDEGVRFNAGANWQNLPCQRSGAA
jgi:hypothetical protein